MRCEHAGHHESQLLFLFRFFPHPTQPNPTQLSVSQPSYTMTSAKVSLSHGVSLFYVLTLIFHVPAM